MTNMDLNIDEFHIVILNSLSVSSYFNLPFCFSFFLIFFFFSFSLYDGFTKTWFWNGLKNSHRLSTQNYTDQIEMISSHRTVFKGHVRILRPAWWGNTATNMMRQYCDQHDEAILRPAWWGNTAPSMMRQYSVQHDEAILRPASRQYWLEKKVNVVRFKYF